MDSHHQKTIAPMSDPLEIALVDSIQMPPENIVERLWQELTRATHDRHHDWKTPALATTGIDGTPRVRTVVLRNADPVSWTLTVYTDTRSPKCAELMKSDTAQFVFWSARLHWQLRISTRARVHTSGALVDAAWLKVSQSRASKDYLGRVAPGSLFLNDAEVGRNSQNKQESQKGKDHHLTVLTFAVQSMDWLSLGREGHIRARVTPDGRVVHLQP